MHNVTSPLPVAVPFATMTMTGNIYTTELTDEGRALPPGDYMLVAVPVSNSLQLPPADTMSEVTE